KPSGPNGERIEADQGDGEQGPRRGQSSPCEQGEGHRGQAGEPGGGPVNSRWSEDGARQGEGARVKVKKLRDDSAPLPIGEVEARSVGALVVSGPRGSAIDGVQREEVGDGGFVRRAFAERS